MPVTPTTPVKHKPSMLSQNKQLAFLAACCLFLATLDYLIPKPLPFMRIGLANLPLLVALPFLSASSFFILLCAKVLVQGLVQGTLFSYVALFSFAGSLTSGFMMFLAYKLGKRHISLVGISMLGALTNNLVQFLLAGALIFKQAAWFIGPPFLILGSISGFILGTFAARFSQKSTWLEQLGLNQSVAEADQTAPPRIRTAEFSLQALPTRLFLCGLLIIPAFLFQNNLIIRLIQTGLFMVLAMSVGKKIKWLFSLILAAGLIAVHLLTPNGEVLFKLASFPVTAGAIRLGLLKTTTFLGLLYLSLFAIHPRLQLPGVFGGLLGRIFYYFERLQESYKQSKKQPAVAAGNLRPNLGSFIQFFNYDNLIARLDMLLTQAYSETEADTADSSHPRTARALVNNPLTGKPFQFTTLTLGSLVALNWLAYSLTFLF